MESTTICRPRPKASAVGGLSSGWWRMPPRPPVSAALTAPLHGLGERYRHAPKPCGPGRRDLPRHRCHSGPGSEAGAWSAGGPGPRRGAAAPGPRIVASLPRLCVRGRRPRALDDIARARGVTGEVRGRGRRTFRALGVTPATPVPAHPSREPQGEPGSRAGEQGCPSVLDSRFRGHDTLASAVTLLPGPAGAPPESALVRRPTLVDGGPYGFPSSSRRANCDSARASAFSTRPARSPQSGILPRFGSYSGRNFFNALVHIRTTIWTVEIPIMQYQPEFEARVRSGFTPMRLPSQRLTASSNSWMFIPVEHRPDRIVLLERMILRRRRLPANPFILANVTDSSAMVRRNADRGIDLNQDSLPLSA